MISVGTNYIFKWQTVVSAQWKKKVHTEENNIDNFTI